jgi:hypothetical protein
VGGGARRRSLPMDRAYVMVLWGRRTSHRRCQRCQRLLAILLRGRFWYGVTRAQRHPPGIDRGTVAGVPHVVPDRRAVSVGGRGVDVVAEEFGGQVVLARSAGVPGVLRWSTLKAPTVPPVTSAWTTTPSSGRSFAGPIVLSLYGSVSAL